MGTSYYGMCHDCKNYIYLDKFYCFAAYDDDDWGIRGYADIEKEKMEDFGAHFVWCSLRLQFFLRKHTDHRVGVHTEHDVDQFGFYEPKRNGWQEQFPPPSPGKEAHDFIDFSDPKAGRLVVKTKYGTLNIDVRHDGVNCFRSVEGRREDTLVLPKAGGE